VAAVQLSSRQLPWPKNLVPSKFLRLGIAALVLADAIAFGVLLPTDPRLALAVAALVPLALGAPLLNLSVVLFVTVLVPFELQDRFAIVGGRGRPSLLLVDVLLLLGLFRVGALILAARLEITASLLTAALIGLVLAAALITGIATGTGVSEAGHEARRTVMGVGTFLLAWPLLNDVVARRRLYMVLTGLGFALGVWGIAQWLLSIDYASAGDLGVRQGVDLGLSGTGQLQGGMFAYPVAIALSWAALVSGRVNSQVTRILLATIFALSAICCLLTYERTLWAASAAACLAVVMRSGPTARRLAARWAPVLIVALLPLVLFAPTALQTAVQRFLSIGQYQTDPSVLYRVIETEAVLAAISERPYMGSGFGATITWGENSDFATITTPFVHNGYLWLAWKIGIPAAAIIALLIARSVVKKNPAGENWRMTVVRTGSKAALLALLIVSVTFSTFDVLGITAVMGLLVALCFRPATRGAAYADT
jgi:O-antigen ligase